MSPPDQPSSDALPQGHPSAGFVPPPPLPVPARPLEPPAPLEDAEIARALVNPLRAFDVVLASAERVGASVTRGAGLHRLVLVFLLAGSLGTIPYACVLSLEEWWKIAAFTLGSMLICLPSLHVFSSYLGHSLRLEQLLVLALTIPATAALFTLGFAPILAFLRFTMDGTNGSVPWRSASVVLLSVAVLAGIGQLWRTWRWSRQSVRSSLFEAVLATWHIVFLYVLLRMGDVLGLGA